MDELFAVAKATRETRAAAGNSFFISPGVTVGPANAGVDINGHYGWNVKQGTWSTGAYWGIGASAIPVFNFAGGIEFLRLFRRPK